LRIPAETVDLLGFGTALGVKPLWAHQDAAIEAWCGAHPDLGEDGDFSDSDSRSSCERGTELACAAASRSAGPVESEHSGLGTVSAARARGPTSCSSYDHPLPNECAC
jgi:hypothetical protein